MPKKVTIELTETQAQIVLRAVEEWFRLRMGQYGDLANDLAFYGYKGDNEDNDAFDFAVIKMGVFEDEIRGMFRMAFPPCGRPHEIEPAVNVASDIWSVLRYELSDKSDRIFTPFKMGKEPLPKITVMEAKKDATD